MHGAIGGGISKMSIEWITTQEAAQLSGYHPERIRELIREQKIKAVKKGSAWWVDRKSLLAFLKQVTKSEDKRLGPRSRLT